MEQRYKLTIFSKNIYQEIELLSDTKQLRLVQRCPAMFAFGENSFLKNLKLNW